MRVFSILSIVALLTRFDSFWDHRVVLWGDRWPSVDE
jgi:hypothetical protein